MAHLAVNKTLVVSLDLKLYDLNQPAKCSHLLRLMVQSFFLHLPLVERRTVPFFIPSLEYDI